MMAKPFSLAIVFLLLLGSGYFFWQKDRDGFRIEYVTYPLPPSQESVPPEVAQLLASPFYYLGKGAQSYAFVDSEGKYVLKLFKFKYLRPSWLLDSLSFLEPARAYRDKRLARKNRLIAGLFAGYRLADARHREEAGLIFAHLAQTKGRLQATLFDKQGKRRQIDLDALPFILQKKGETTETVLQELLNRGAVEAAENKIRALFRFYTRQYAKGLYDRDHDILHNIGFLDEKPIHLDVGKLSENGHMREARYYRPDIEKVAARLETWLEARYPLFYPSLQQAIRDELEISFNGKSLSL